MAVGEIIMCCTTEEVIEKAVELMRKGIRTELASNHSLRFVSISEPSA